MFSWELALDIFQMAVIVIAMTFLYKSYPADKADELIKKLAEAAERTQTKTDDLAVMLLELLNNMLVVEEPPEEPKA